jgi:hypothetical protein
MLALDDRRVVAHPGHFEYVVPLQQATAVKETVSSSSPKTGS